MDNLEYIDAYFHEEFSAEEKTEFEKKITTDPMFAEEVAFYFSAKQAANQELTEEKQRFREIYTGLNQSNSIKEERPAVVRRLWPWAAAAALLAGIIFGWYAWFRPANPKQLADKYMVEHFQTLPVTMSSKEDSLQAGLRLYNEGRLDEALRQFESLALQDASYADAKKYAGIVSLRLGQYDKAINYFSQLSDYTLHANPGKFYNALTLLKRNLPGDKEAARQLLLQVVENDLAGKEDAGKWLKKW